MASVRLQVLGVGFEIRSNDRGLLSDLSNLWAAFVSEEAPSGDAVIEITNEGDNWRMQLFGGSSFANPDVWLIADHLNYHIEEFALQHASQVVGLHAAVVVKHDSALILPAQSGTGKTTLTLDLLTQGWSYFSDDLAPLELGSGSVLPFPRAMRVRDARRISEIPFIDPATIWTTAAGDQEAALIPPSALPRSELARVRPRWVVFPTYRPRIDPDLAELSPAHAAARAAQHARRKDPEALHLIARVCAEASCFSLRYGSSEQAMQALNLVCSA